jgi:hypothetical protein
LNNLKGIDLGDSFVLSWNKSEYELVFELVASIWPDSKHYIIPHVGEYACYKIAELKVTGFKTCSGLLDFKGFKPTIDLDGSEDYGNIDSFIKTEAGFKIEGDFGLVTIAGGEHHFTIHS